MKDFNTITEKEESEVKAKFRDFGAGLQMGAYASGDISKWEDLINPNLFSNTAIKTKMLEIARRINTMCNDELLGDLDVAFVMSDQRGKVIEFTWLDMYTFLRAAYRYRIETKDYLSKKAKLEKLRNYVEENKSVEDRLAEATKEMKELEKELS